MEVGKASLMWPIWSVQGQLETYEKRIIIIIIIIIATIMYWALLDWQLYREHYRVSFIWRHEYLLALNK